MDSIWKKTIRLPKFEPLRRDICADVLVIGGGLAGLLCAHELTRDLPQAVQKAWPGADPRIPGGQSGGAETDSGYLFGYPL